MEETNVETPEVESEVTGTEPVELGEVTGSDAMEVA